MDREDVCRISMKTIIAPMKGKRQREGRQKGALKGAKGAKVPLRPNNAIRRRFRLSAKRSETWMGHRVVYFFFYEQRKTTDARKVKRTATSCM